MSNKLKILLPLVCIAIFIVGALTYTKAQDLGALRVFTVSQGGTGLGDKPVADEILVGDGSGKYVLNNIGSAISGFAKWYIDSNGWLTTTTTIDVYINGTASSTSLQVGGTAPASFSGNGDIYASDTIKAMGGFYAEAKPYGAGLEILNAGSATTYTNILNGDATLTASTQIITDTHASFDSSYEGQFLRVISSAAPSFGGATGEVQEVLDATHLVVSFGTSGQDVIPDATAMNFVIYPAPNFFVGDNGDFELTVGNNEDAVFGIEIPEGNGFTGVYIDDIAGADQHQALTIDVDSQGYDGIVALNLFMQNASSTNPSSGVLEVMASLEGNANNYLNSSLRFMDFNLIGTGTDNDVDIMHINNFPLTSHIIHSGNPNDLERAYYDNGDGTTIDSTTAFNSTGTNITLFENDNSIIYIAGATDTEFINMAFDISTESQRNINAEYYYCDGDDSWKVLTGVIDTTNGFKQSGSINFMNPVDRGQCNEEIDSTAFADTDARSYIAIKRTRSNNWVGQKPIENLVSISGGGSYLYMDSYGVKPVGSAGAPYTCTASEAGMTYYDTVATSLLWCTGSAWTAFAEISDITVHNNLSGIQGGTSAEYYHLDAADYTEVSNWLPNVTLTSGGSMTVVNATTTGSMYVTGDLTVAGDTTLVDIVQQNTTVNGTLSVTQDTHLATVSGNVGIGTTTPAGMLDVDGRLVVLDSGNVGIGTTGPGEKLQVAGSIGITAGVAAFNASRLVLDYPLGNVSRIMSIGSSGVTGSMVFSVASPGAASYIEAMRINESGNVGIGTTDPQAALDISQSRNFYVEDLRLTSTGSLGASSHGIDWYDYGDTWNSARIATIREGALDSFSLAFSTRATPTLGEKMRITSSGNVGIGTTDPVAKLEISNTNPSTINPLVKLNYGAGLGAGGYMSFGQVGFELGRIENVVDASGQASLRFYDYNTALEEVMRISSGNVGIGTTGPQGKLDVAGMANTNGIHFTGVSGRNDPLLTIESTGATGGGAGYDAGLLVNISAMSSGASALNIAKAGGSLLYVQGSGNVGIGTTIPQNLLDVGGMTISGQSGIGNFGVKSDANNVAIRIQEPSDGAEEWDIGVNPDGDLTFYDSSVATPKVTFQDVSGNVGIGTTDPASKLAIAGANQTYGLLHLDSTDEANLWLDSGSSSYDDIIYFAEAGTAQMRLQWDASENHLAVTNTGGTRLMVVEQSSGNVGIGTTTPDQLLTLDGGGLCIDDGTGFCGDQNNTAGSATTTGSGYFGGDLRVVGTLDSSDIRFDNGFILTEGDKVGLDENELILLNEKGEVAFRFLSDGTLIAKNGIKQEPVKQNYWYLLGLLGLLGLAFKRK